MLPLKMVQPKNGWEKQKSPAMVVAGSGAPEDLRLIPKIQADGVNRIQDLGVFRAEIGGNGGGPVLGPLTRKLGDNESSFLQIPKKVCVVLFVEKSGICIQRRVASALGKPSGNNLQTVNQSRKSLPQKGQAAGSLLPRHIITKEQYLGGVGVNLNHFISPDTQLFSEIDTPVDKVPKC